MFSYYLKTWRQKRRFFRTERPSHRRRVLPHRVIQDEAELSPTQLQGRGPHPLRHDGDRIAINEKRRSLFEFSLRLSRACLGKRIVFR